MKTQNVKMLKIEPQKLKRELLNAYHVTMPTSWGSLSDVRALHASDQVHAENAEER